MSIDERKRARRGRVAVTPYALRLASALWETSSRAADRGRRGRRGRPGRHAGRDRGACATGPTSEGARVVAVRRDARRLRPHRRHRVVSRRRGGHGPARSRPHRERRRAARAWPRRERRSASPGPVRRAATESSASAAASASARSRSRRWSSQGHTDDGIGCACAIPDVLIVGDYLSPIEYPFVYHSTAAYRSTLAGLADLLRSDPPALVVPGHGAPPRAGRRARDRREDLAYLHALRRAVAHAIAAGADREAAIQAAIAVPTPRSLPVDAGRVAAQRRASIRGAGRVLIGRADPPRRGARAARRRARILLSLVVQPLRRAPGLRRDRQGSSARRSRSTRARSSPPASSRATSARSRSTPTRSSAATSPCATCTRRCTAPRSRSASVLSGSPKLTWSSLDMTAEVRPGALAKYLRGVLATAGVPGAEQGVRAHGAGLGDADRRQAARPGAR